MALLTIDPAENYPMPLGLRGSASMAHRAGHPPPRHHHRIMTAPAITRPRKTGTIIGGTNHSRSLNVWMVDMLTALVVAGVHVSQSPIAAKGGR
jgi:hypothetical protein